MNAMLHSPLYTAQLRHPATLSIATMRALLWLLLIIP